jgi:hypothetical protein
VQQTGQCFGNLKNVAFAAKNSRANDPENKIELKSFLCEILNDHKALKEEEENHKEIEMIRTIDNSMVQRNYLQVNRI